MEGVRAHLERVAAIALSEDLGGGELDADVTTTATIADALHGRGELVAKQAGVACGLLAFEVSCDLLGGGVGVTQEVQDGARVASGDVLLQAQGPVRVMLVAERTALNLVARLSGIATATAAFVDRAPGVEVADTRKTTPGLRALEKHAVATGGGTNHRMGLWDGVLLKDTHVDAAGGVAEAVRLAKAATALPVQAECRSLDELTAALDAGADAVLLDNFDVAGAAQAVHLVRASGRNVFVEASGAVTLETVADYAATGVDRVSVGALTHSAPALDVSFRLLETWEA